MPAPATARAATHPAPGDAACHRDGQATVLRPVYTQGPSGDADTRPLGSVRYGGQEAGLYVEAGCVCMTLPGTTPALYEHWYRTPLDIFSSSGAHGSQETGQKGNALHTAQLAEHGGPACAPASRDGDRRVNSEAEAAITGRSQPGRSSAPSLGTTTTSAQQAEDLAAENRQSGLEDGIGWSREGDVLFAAFWLADQPALEEAVQTHYERLITLTRQKGYPHIYRMWNYLGAINQDNARGEERYRDFCSGRAQAFEAMGIGLEDLPAATGIGLPSGGVAVFLIAQKDRVGINQENPCQLPAYHYPPRYGRRSPSFARATVMTGSAQTILYLSGTASIRGHETIGTTLEEQITVTIETINTLLRAAKDRFATLQSGRFESLKLYVRHPHHAPAVKQAITKAFPCPPSQAPLLIADICRADLLLEVEGVFVGHSGV